MLNRCCSLIVLIFLMTGCHKSVTNTSTVMTEPSAHLVKQYRQVESFNQVDIQGSINVNLHTGYKKSQVLLSGDSRDLEQVKTVIKNGILYLTIGGGYPKYGAVSADVRTSSLSVIRYKGAGTLTGNQLSSPALDIYLANKGPTTLGGSIGVRTLQIDGGGFTQINGITSRYMDVTLKGDPKVQLRGMANIRKLNMDGSGWISLYWIKSDALTIRAKTAAQIQLAGVVNRLDVELWGKSQFKGRYLRAQRSFVKTHDHSIAEISSVNHQSNLATDASDIYYYNLPNTRADFMAFNGSVLDMREWFQTEMRDFDRYNKQFP